MSMAEEEGVCYLPPKFCIQVYISVLEEVLDQLFILKQIYNWTRLPKTDSNYKTLEERFGKYSEPIVKDKTTNDVQNNLSIFLKSFALIETTLKITFDELKENGTYEKLLKVINVSQKTICDEEFLKEDTVRKQTELKKLKDAIYDEKIFYHQKIEECMAAIGRVKDEIEDFKVEGEMKIKYVTSWQNSKIEINDILLERMEEEKTKNVKKLDSDIYKEIRVHQEILAAYNEIQMDLEDEITKWKARYHSTLKDLEDKINNLKKEQENRRDKTTKLNELFLQRQKKMDDFKKYKVKQEEKRRELKRRNKAATKIQAWWRGTMVRKGFGKFRKKRDKKKKKSSEKKSS